MSLIRFLRSEKYRAKLEVSPYPYIKGDKKRRTLPKGDKVKTLAFVWDGGF